MTLTVNVSFLAIKILCTLPSPDPQIAFEKRKGHTKGVYMPSKEMKKIKASAQREITNLKIIKQIKNDKETFKIA